MQVDPRSPETPGNLVLDGSVDESPLRRLADLARTHGGHIWPQLGHAGALSFLPVSDPVGPSALDIDGIRQPSRLMVDKITTVPRATLGERIGRLSDDDIARLARSIVVFLGLATS